MTDNNEANKALIDEATLATPAEAPPGFAPPAAASLSLGVIGNCSYSALVDQRARIVWCCLPRFDGEPVFNALLHPGGKIGRSVMRVFELMRSGPSNPVVRDNAKLSEAVVVMTNTPGRPGATNVVDRQGRLVGIFTDGDLRRLAEEGPEGVAQDALDGAEDGLGGPARESRPVVLEVQAEDPLGGRAPHGNYRVAAAGTSLDSSSSTIGAASPWRGPSFSVRV